MLGRERDRLDKVWLVTDDAPSCPTLRRRAPTATRRAVLRVPRAALAAWLQPAAGHALEDHLYLVDPMGDWMMRVPADPTRRKVKRDLERLLRASASWDTRRAAEPRHGRRTPVDLAPALRMLLLALCIALLPLAWVWLRHRGADAGARGCAALTALTLFLTFDLIVFGAFTRLTDSGLGCPDWPGCYGNASPVGAAADIHAAQTAHAHRPGDASARPGSR